LIESVFGTSPEAKAKGGIQQERPCNIWKWKGILVTFHSFIWHLESFRMKSRKLTVPFWIAKILIVFKSCIIFGGS